MMGLLDTLSKAGLSGAIMTEGISRRSRSFVAEHEDMEARRTGKQSRYNAEEVIEKEKHKEPSLRTSSSTESLDDSFGIPTVDVMGEDMTRHVTTSNNTLKVSIKAKQGGRPLNFGVIDAGFVYRSGFPKPEDYKFIGSLGLKSIITLVKGPYDDHFLQFMEARGIRHYVFEMQGTKKVEISAAMMKSIMEIALDERNHPLLMHCNRGIHRTGCAAAAMRIDSGWTFPSTLIEYESYAGDKVRDCDRKYINGYHVLALEDVRFEVTSFRYRPAITTRKMCRMICLAILAIMFWLGVFSSWWID